jgi:hypothetical protein
MEELFSSSHILGEVYRDSIELLQKGEALNTRYMEAFKEAWASEYREDVSKVAKILMTSIVSSIPSAALPYFSSQVIEEMTALVLSAAWNAFTYGFDYSQSRIPEVFRVAELGQEEGQDD